MKDKIHTLRSTKAFHTKGLRKEFNYDGDVQLVQNAKCKGQDGYRIEFINMVKSLSSLASR